MRGFIIMHFAVSRPALAWPSQTPAIYPVTDTFQTPSVNRGFCGTCDCFYFQTENPFLLFGKAPRYQRAEIIRQMEMQLEKLREIQKMGRGRFMRDPLLQDASLHAIAQLGVWAKQLKVIDPEHAMPELVSLRNQVVHNPSAFTPELVWSSVTLLSKIHRENLPRRLWFSFPKGGNEELTSSQLHELAWFRLQRLNSHLAYARNEEVFLRSPLLQRAIAYNLAVLGEIANKSAFQALCTVPAAKEALKQLKQVRDRLLHPEHFSQARRPEWLWQRLQHETGDAIITLQSFLSQPVESKRPALFSLVS
jgi:uncharacterized protein with HEPN domain